MNRYAMQHIVDSAYCFPVSEKEIVLRLRTAKDDIKSVQIIYESKYVFGQSQKRAEMQKTYTSELYDYYVIHLVLEDTRLAYVFYLNDGEKNYFSFSFIDVNNLPYCDLGRNIFYSSFIVTLCSIILRQLIVWEVLNILNMNIIRSLKAKILF